MSVTPFVYYHPGPGPLKFNEEVDAAVWAPLAYLGDPGNVTPYAYPRDPESRAFPSFFVEGRYTIWGMTFRMVGSFTKLFGVELPVEGELTNVE